MQVTREVFEASKGRLKVVGRAGVGIDNVDLQAATEVSLKHYSPMNSFFSLVSAVAHQAFR